jgi:nucleotide-binding universal stress UspA family protein
MPAPVIAAYDPDVHDRTPVALALAVGDVIGSPVVAGLEAALADALRRASEHVDLLVCGWRRCGSLQRVVLGGVSRRLIDTARCPVIVLPRQDHPQLEDCLDGADRMAAR